MKEDTYTTDEMIHIATQYLVSAVKSYTSNPIINFYDSIEFCDQEGCLKTKPFNKSGDQLRLHYKGFILEWCNNDHDINAILFLQKSTHKKIMNWISKIAYASGINKPFVYEFHSKNSCAIMHKNFTFENVNHTRLAQLADYRISAQEILNEAIKVNQLQSEVCSWTSNFNTVTYALLNPKKDIVVELGITKPNAESTIKNQQKIFISAWQGLNFLKNQKVKKLGISKHVNDQYLASIPYNDSEKQKALNFINKALNIFKQEYYLESI